MNFIIRIIIAILFAGFAFVVTSIVFGNLIENKTLSFALSFGISALFLLFALFGTGRGGGGHGGDHGSGGVHNHDSSGGGFDGGGGGD